MDLETLKDFATRPQTRIAPLAAATLGDLSRQADIDEPHKGTISVYFSKGLFLGAQFEMGTLNARPKQNKKFYGTALKPWDIISYEGAVKIPEKSGIPDLHRKLEMLELGKSWTPSNEDHDKSGRLLVEAQKSGAMSRLESDVELASVARSTSKE